MKKGVIFLLSLFMLSSVSAAPLLEFQNEEILPGETILATITTIGEFIKEIRSSDISFYEGRKQKYFEYDIRFYNGTYYLSIYPIREGEFSIHVSDILYKDANGLNSISIIKPFNVTDKFEIDEETNETLREILSIRPGFVYIPQTSKLKLANKGTVTLELEYEEKQLTLEPLAVEEIEFNPKEKFSYFEISGYKDFSIPIIHPTADIEFQSPSTKPDLRANPDSLVVELFTDTKKEEIIELLNFGDLNLTNLKIGSDISFLKIGKIDDMEGKEIQNLTLTFDAENAGYFEGIIEINYSYENGTGTSTIPVAMKVLPKGTPEEEFEEVDDTCEGLSGNVCKKGYLCDPDAKQPFTSDNVYCCLGICELKEEEEKEESNLGTIIAVIILAGIVGYGYYAYKKQKKTVPKKPEEKLKESSEKFEKRMAGKPTSRVKGSLTKN